MKINSDAIFAVRRPSSIEKTANALPQYLFPLLASITLYRKVEDLLILMFVNQLASNENKPITLTQHRTLEQTNKKRDTG